MGQTPSRTAVGSEVTENGHENPQVQSLHVITTYTDEDERAAEQPEVPDDQRAGARPAGSKKKWKQNLNEIKKSRKKGRRKDGDEASTVCHGSKEKSKQHRRQEKSKLLADKQDPEELIRQNYFPNLASPVLGSHENTTETDSYLFSETVDNNSLDSSSVNMKQPLDSKEKLPVDAGDTPGMLASDYFDGPDQNRVFSPDSSEAENHDSTVSADLELLELAKVQSNPQPEHDIPLAHVTAAETFEPHRPPQLNLSGADRVQGSRSVSEGSSRRRMTFNPFSRRRNRLNIFNSPPLNHSVQSSIEPSSPTTRAHDAAGTVAEPPAMPSINLSSLTHFNRNFQSTSTLNSPTTPTSTLPRESSNFVHQAQMLSRLLELAAHSTLHNLIGDYEGDDGLRIDNQSRNRDLRERVPANRFEDGSDANFNEFSVALQGNLLANELSNSIRLQETRDRRRQQMQARDEQLRARGEPTEPASSDNNNSSGSDDAEAEEDPSTVSMSFFRAFRFSSRRPRNVEDDEDAEDQVPVLIIGVRSVLPEEADRVNGAGGNDIHMNNIIPGTNNESHSLDSTSFRDLSNSNLNLFTHSNNSSSANLGAGVSQENLSNSFSSLRPVSSDTGPGEQDPTTPTTGGFARSFFRSRNHRSRFRLENSRNNNRLEEIAQQYGQNRTRTNRSNGTQRSWVIFIMGHTFPLDHPVLSAPTLLADNPTYEDLLALQAMLGEVKPPVATQEDVDRAEGLFVVYTDLDWLEENDLMEEYRYLEKAKVPVADQCLVCLTEYESGEVCRRLKSCDHFFHKECIDQWLVTGRNSCPLCRKKGVVVKKKAPVPENDVPFTETT